MCGRSCLTLSPTEIQHACQYRTSKTTDTTQPPKSPEFRAEYNCGRSYAPSFNVAPTDITPVLISAAHYDDQLVADRILVPMLWGMIPPWHRGAATKHGLSTNNCRLESLQQSRLYAPALERGQRCVILCEGFYEWQTTKEGLKPSERDAYYFYVPQGKKVQSETEGGAAVKQEPTLNQPDAVKPEPDKEQPELKPTEPARDDSKHHNLLKIAGLFDVWTDEHGDNLYSYTVITFESDASFAWLHHRSPAILETDEQVANWLDFTAVGPKAALRLLRPARTLEWHRVASVVNNARNKSADCNKPYVEKERKKSTAGALQAWLGGSAVKRKRSPAGDEDKVKEVKKEKC